MSGVSVFDRIKGKTLLSYFSSSAGGGSKKHNHLIKVVESRDDEGAAATKEAAAAVLVESVEVALNDRKNRLLLPNAEKKHHRNQPKKSPSPPRSRFTSPSRRRFASPSSTRAPSPVNNKKTTHPPVKPQSSNNNNKDAAARRPRFNVLSRTQHWRSKSAPDATPAALGTVSVEEEVFSCSEGANGGAARKNESRARRKDAPAIETAFIEPNETASTTDLFSAAEETQHTGFFSFATHLAQSFGAAKQFGETGTAAFSESSSDSESSSASSSSSGTTSPPPTTILPNNNKDEASVVSVIRPFAGSSTREVGRGGTTTTSDPSSASSPSTAPLLEDEPCQPVNGWRQVPAETLMVRSANYHKTHEKVPSLEALYECLRVDVLRTPQRTPKMSTRVELPDLEDDDDYYPDERTWDAPDFFVVTLSVPLSRVHTNTEKKPCVTIVMYFGMTAETRRILKRLTTYTTRGVVETDGVEVVKDPSGLDGNAKVHAARLFNDWCRRAPTDPSFQGRFKFIPQVDTLDNDKNGASTTVLPPNVSKWNGKPVLLKRPGKTGVLHAPDTQRDDEVENYSVMEMEISLHAFPRPVRQGVETLRHKVAPRSLLTLGFVIEGRDESELPEVLIGLTQLCQPRIELAVSSKDFFMQ